MATWERRTVQVTRVEYRVPAALPYGAHSDEVSKAFAAAKQSMKTLGVETDIFVAPEDDDVVIYFEYDKRIGP